MTMLRQKTILDIRGWGSTMTYMITPSFQTVPKDTPWCFLMNITSGTRLQICSHFRMKTTFHFIPLCVIARQLL
jgi:hypothetical protein